MTVTVYTKPGCVQCTFTSRKLDAAGIAHELVDVTTDSDARDFVMSLGYLSLPVVVTDTEHWSGLRVDRISRLAATAA